MIRYLVRWPFEPHVVQAECVYAGLELNTFRNVCQYFLHLAPLLEPVFAMRIMAVCRHFRSMATASIVTDFRRPTPVTSAISLADGKRRRGL